MNLKLKRTNNCDMIVNGHTLTPDGGDKVIDFTVRPLAQQSMLFDTNAAADAVSANQRTLACLFSGYTV